MGLYTASKICKIKNSLFFVFAVCETARRPFGQLNKIINSSLFLFTNNINTSFYYYVMIYQTLKRSGGLGGSAHLFYDEVKQVKRP